MAGHSHFKNIKRKKEASDQKRGVVFSKISRLIISSVKEKGKDPSSNSSLRIAIEKAKEADMPKENIDRAIKRGSGEGDEGKLEDFLYEAYGPENIAIIIAGSTDNKNRNLEEIKEILKKHDGKLADLGSVKWLFSQKGIIEIDSEKLNDNLSLKIIEEGAEDINERDGSIIIYTSPDNIKKIRNFLSERGVDIITAYLGWQPQKLLNIKDDKCERLLQSLRESESVEAVYTNI